MIRIFSHYLPIRLLLLTLVEAAVLFESVAMFARLRAFAEPVGPPIIEAGVFTFIMLMMMTALGMYQTKAEAFRATVQRLVVAWVLAVIIVSAMFYLIPAADIGRANLGLASVVALGGVLLVRVLFFRITDVGLPKRRVLVVGNGAEAEQIIRFLHEGNRGRNVQYAGLYPVVAEREATDQQRRINHAQLRRTVRDLRVSEIVIAVRDRRGGVLPLRQLLDCKLQGVRVMDLASFYERELGLLQVDQLRASWLIFGEGFNQGIVRDVVKRIFDVLVSLIILAVTLPVLLLGMLAVVLDSRGPLFYRQERVGQGGKRFSIYKLRSMRVDAEKDGQPRWAVQNDARITRVGRFLRKTRIDELPQVYNVLRGDMSFVGPRPERAFFVDQLIEQIPYYDVRHSIKPGVTGWSQVRYPYGASVDDALAKLQYDLYYVKNHSLFLDLLILVETLQVVLLGKGAR